MMVLVVRVIAMIVAVIIITDDRSLGLDGDRFAKYCSTMVDITNEG